MGDGPYKIMIVAGEASGDLHAAKLVRAVRDASPETLFEFFGAAGEKMRSAGVEPVIRSDELSVVGLLEIGRALPMFLRTLSALERAFTVRQPHLVILVDFPDFNLKLARKLYGRGAKIAYYISPQLWAWRQYRIRTIRDCVDVVVSILPFEKDWYLARGVSKVEYVGSPLAREVQPLTDKVSICDRHGLDPAKSIIALLPGSRHKEIVRILPVMVDTARVMVKQDGELQFVVAVGSQKNFSDVQSILKRSRFEIPVSRGETFDVVSAADAAVVASGTATLETGIIGTPMAVVYKTSALNFTLLRPLIDVPHFGLINLIAGERIAKEFIQDEFTPEALSVELFHLLKPEVNREVREQLRQAVDKLGHGGASKRAAEVILRLLRPIQEPLQPPFGGIA